MKYKPKTIPRKGGLGYAGIPRNGRPVESLEECSNCGAVIPTEEQEEHLEICDGEKPDLE